MNYDKLMKEIQLAGEFGERHHAEAAAEAVLSVLGERLAGREPAHLAAQLPVELAIALPSEGGRDTFGVDEFDRRVAEREGLGCGPFAAHRHAVAVMSTICAAITEGERADLVAQLPRDFVDLVG